MSTIEVTCQHCGTALKASADAIGRTTKCPKCQKEMTIRPATAAEVDTGALKYPALSAISWIYKAIGVLSLIVSVGAFFVGAFTFFNEGIEGEWIAYIPVTIGAFVTAVSFFAVSEVIQLFMDIEKGIRLLRYR